MRKKGGLKGPIPLLPLGVTSLKENDRELCLFREKKKR